MGILKEIGDRSATAEALLGFACVLVVHGDLETARRLSQESLAILRELGNKDSIAACLEDLAVVLAAQEVPRMAARLWGTAEAIRKAIGAPMLPVDRADYERAVAAARTELGEEAFAKAWAEGGTLPLEEVLDEVLKRAPEAYRKFVAQPTRAAYTAHPSPLPRGTIAVLALVATGLLPLVHIGMASN